jgi:hypothetical protein
MVCLMPCKSIQKVCVGEKGEKLRVNNLEQLPESYLSSGLLTQSECQVQVYTLICAPT